MKRLFFFTFCLGFLLTCEDQTPQTDKLVFTKKHWLIGKWKAKAFNGHLHETWQLQDKHLQNEAYYVEDGDTSYSEIVIIDASGDTLPTLRALPINNKMLEYKGLRYSPTEMIFKSDTEKTPFQINYRYIDKKHFTRTIYGDDDGIEYETVFEFERVDH